MKLKPTWLEDPVVTKLLGALGAPAVDVRFVGGCVRDAVLEIDAKDLDIATPETPPAVMQRLEAAGMKAIPTGIEHGTVTAVIDRRPFEITTLRRDVATDGRHAEVAFTDNWQADAARRDFTMNAMSLKPSGELFDYFKGASDARVGRMRFVGEPAKRIAEDHLRILRLFRFQATYGKKPLSPALLEECARFANLLDTISAERIQQELRKLLSAPNPVASVADMNRAGVLKVILPEAAGGQNLLKEVMVEAAYGVPENWLLRLAAMIGDNPASADAVAARLKMSNDDAAQLKRLLGPEPEIWMGMPLIALGGALYHHGQDLVRGRTALTAARGQYLRGWTEIFAAIRSWKDRPLPISGADIVALGVPAGPKVGALLDAATTQWIGSNFTASKDDLLVRAKAEL